MHDCCAALGEMEADELLALLADLGAQQQAVLAAIVGKHPSPQKAASKGHLRESTLASGCSGVSMGRSMVNISAAAGESATAAQQQKPWRVPGGQSFLQMC